MSSKDAVDSPIRVFVYPPVGFNPESEKHKAKILRAIENEYGEGYVIAGYDTVTNKLSAEKPSAITVFNEAGADKLVRIGDGEDTGNLQRLAKKFEDQVPGYLVVDFDLAKKPPRATMRPHTERERQLRESLSVALDCPRAPWNVQVKELDDGVVSFEVPPSYVPSKHDSKLLEVATTVAGEPGWFVKVDPKSRMGKIVPGELPTFPKFAPHPLNDVVQKISAPNDTSWMRTPIGLALNKPGEEQEMLRINNAAAYHTMYQGRPNSGKSLCVNSHIWYFVAHGAEVAVIDTPAKAMDFEWVRPYVMEGGWGCDSIERSLSTANLVLKKADERSAIIKRHGAKNWTEVKGPDAFPPLLVVIDEFTTLCDKTDPLKSLSKDHPLRLAAEASNAMVDLFKSAIQQIALESRAMGVFVILATQLANSTTGMPPKLKTGFGNYIAMGANLSDNQKMNAFASPKDAPKVPDHILAAEGVSKGVGISELEGVGMDVFKGFFVSEHELRKNLDANPNLSRPGGSAPDDDLVFEYVPHDIVTDARNGRRGAASTGDEKPSEETGGGGVGSEGLRLAREEGLMGAAAASYALAYDAAQAKKAQAKVAELCSACGAALDERANCHCS